MTVTILGAGVAGLCTATELLRHGIAVQLVDPSGGPGPQGCSWWAGGMLAPFCEGESADPQIVAQGQEAADWWQQAGAEVTRAGSLVVTQQRDRQELDRFARRTSGHVRLDRDGLAGLDPVLADRHASALHFPTEAHLAPRQALSALRDGLTRQGVTVQPEAPAPGLTVDCRGLAARDLLPDLRGVRGEMAVLRAPGVTLPCPVRLLHPRHPLYIVPRGDGVFMLGATQIESAARGPATLRSVVELLSAAYALDPGFGEAEVLELGADARPAFPDNLPRVLERDGRIHVNGLFRHGFLMAPALARQAAALVLAKLKELPPCRSS
ncbi:MAG TPA: FAD-dependent oxidoreductase [Citreicella sp.]|nr:FAD-dependent oxidoreductase [Citreicella sp.]